MADDGTDTGRATVRELTTDAEWDAAVPLLCQLWTDADPEFVRSWRDEADYHLFGLCVDGDTGADPGLVGVAGVSVQRVLHHARHAWIHDLVVDETRRSRGYGTEFLDFVTDWARERDCGRVALASRLGNDDALRFYEDAGLERWDHVVERDL
jgi:GNAT superfamily N-acetyltransferase